MNSPISPLAPLSPRMGAFPLRNRVPTQLRRSVPIYLVCVTLLLLILNADVLTIPKSPSPSRITKRHARQKPISTSQSPSPAEGFPRKIWQTWKTDPYNFEKRDFDTARSWTTRNPGWRYEVLTDNNDLAYVEAHFGPGGLGRPDIVEMYRAINATIIKADLLRYMVMYAEGGVYADIDVEALKPVSRFVPERYDPQDIDMVIGVEVDQPEFRDHPILGPKSMSFCQWTFMCKPRLPVMLALVENIMNWLSDVAAKQNVPVSEVVLDFDEVISGTGPSAFTLAVLAEMNRVRGDSSQGGDDEITWDRFHSMDESRLVSRILVLDVEAFAAGQGHSDSGNHNARGALVKHHYHASNWPSKHPRFSHPVYGEVERCNWDAACVRKWDADVEAYATLSPEEQRRKMEERDVERARQMEEARAAQEQAVKLEQLGQAVRKAEEEARKRAEEEAAAQRAQAPPAAGFGGSPPPPQVQAPAAPEAPGFHFPAPQQQQPQPPARPLSPFEIAAQQQAAQHDRPFGSL